MAASAAARSLAFLRAVTVVGSGAGLNGSAAVSGGEARGVAARTLSVGPLGGRVMARRARQALILTVVLSEPPPAWRPSKLQAGSST